MKIFLTKIALALALFGGMLLAGFGLTRFETIARADVGSVIVATGSGSGSVATPSPSSQLHDPIADPTDFVGDLKTAKTKGWFALVLVFVYGLARALGTLDKKYAWLAWLNKGKAAMLLAGSVVVVAASIDALFNGGTLASIGIAALWAAVGLLMPTKQATT